MPYKDNMSYKEISELTPKIEQYAAVAVQNGSIDPQLYGKYDVKRGLRDVNGKGVLAGLTEISDIRAFEEKDGVAVPCDGKLYYRGYDIEEIVPAF